MTDPEAPAVDDPAHDRFAVDQDGAIAQLSYRTGGGRLILVHTEVPEEIGGGEGSPAASCVRRSSGGRDGLTLVPWCPYARTWLEDHPDVAATVTIDWTPPAPPTRSPA